MKLSSRKAAGLLGAAVAYALALCPAAAHQVSVSGGQNGAIPEGYVPPMLGNGSLSIQLDFEGCQSQRAYAKIVPTIYRAGRRYGPPKDQLVPLGHLEQSLSIDGRPCRPPVRWEQTLDTDAGLVRSVAEYGEGFRIETTALVLLDQDCLAVHRRVVPSGGGAVGGSGGGAKSVRIEYRYHFSASGQGNVPPRRVTLESPRVGPDGIGIAYRIDGFQACDALTEFLADVPVTTRVDRQTFALASEFDAGRPAEATWYLLMADSIDGPDYRERMARLRSKLRGGTFADLRAGHEAAWRRYWSESRVDLPDRRMEQVYDTSQYHLRINTTRWSSPVALLNTHWAGRYFAWDETFGFLGLASSNHLAISARIPDYRFATLPVALRRTAHYGQPESYGARYVWEDMEGGAEGTPPGFWLDHVFHIGNIALSSWSQYLYSGDEGALRARGYPVIRECATFFERQMIYDAPDGGKIIGRCTDLERLGPARLNPFLTSCSAICALETAARAAVLLHLDADRIDAWRTLAKGLRGSLPNDGQRYLPYPGCQEVSIAVLGGLFPYPVLDPADPMQANAIRHFVDQGARAGNMYPMGESVCAWYGAWMACALVALGEGDRAADLLGQVARGAGRLAEIFEINEAKVVMRPWFSTAEGTYVTAVNQMLLSCRDDQIHVARGVPGNWKEFSFELPAHGNLLVDAEMRGGRITRLKLKPGDPAATLSRTVVIPERLLDPGTLNRAAIEGSEVRDGRAWLRVRFRGETALLN